MDAVHRMFILANLVTLPASSLFHHFINHHIHITRRECPMKRTSFALVLGLSLLLGVSASRAEDPTGFRGDLLGHITYVQKKVLDLEGSLPASKMTWRPNKDVRTVSEVYSHIAYENYFFAKFAGVAPPEGISFASPDDGTKWEKASTSKEVIHEQLVKSFSFVKDGIKNVSDASLDETVDFFGNKMTRRSVLMAMLTHIHEHLGQSIAYARMLGVVPPWTAAETAAANAMK
jgi:uncharacterized damage-inducible protein DinB